MRSDDRTVRGVDVCTLDCTASGSSSSSNLSFQLPASSSKLPAQAPTSTQFTLPPRPSTITAAIALSSSISHGHFDRKEPTRARVEMSCPPLPSWSELWGLAEDRPSLGSLGSIGEPSTLKPYPQLCAGFDWLADAYPPLPRGNQTCHLSLRWLPLALTGCHWHVRLILPRTVRCGIRTANHPVPTKSPHAIRRSASRLARSRGGRIQHLIR